MEPWEERILGFSLVEKAVGVMSLGSSQRAPGGGGWCLVLGGLVF